MHDAAIRAWQRWHTLRDPQRFEAWFTRIVVNVCRDRWRRRHRRDAVTMPPSPQSALDRAIARFPEVELLESAIRALPADERTVLALRFMQDLTLAQIAQRIGAPLGTVKSRLHRAMGSLRTAYAELSAEADER